MGNLLKLRMSTFLGKISVFCMQSNHSPSKSNLYANGSSHTLQFLRFCTTERGVKFRNGANLCEKKFHMVRREAQLALLEYLHITRNLQFMDADNMSKNSPEFLDRLLKRVDVDDDGVGHSLTRFFRYHPINEFEPFFESIGLKPCEYASFLPLNLMFLSDEEFLLNNYHVLCYYGIERNWIGKIYKEAREVFRYDRGVLESKLQSFQDLGLKHSLVVKMVASSPYILLHDVNQELVEFLGMLKNLGIEYDWLEDHIFEGDSYNWKHMFELMCSLGELGLSMEKLGEVIKNHPDLLLDHSGRSTFHIFVFLLKFGLTKSDLQTLFLQFPHVSVVNFINNLCRCYNFFIEIRMPVQDIGRMFGFYPLLLGSCELKKVHSLRCLLHCRVDQISQMVRDDPFVLKKWVLGVRVERLLEPSHVSKVRMIKTKFLLSLGFVEKSQEMERALKLFRGKAVELQERFNCLVNAGLSRDDVIAMLKVTPQIVNQSKDVIERKIGSFVHDLGYPVSDIVTCPELVSYKTERVKLRLLMYEWLKDKGSVNQKLALSSLLSCSDDRFVKNYVNSHPRGPEFWKRLKREICSI